MQTQLCISTHAVAPRCYVLLRAKQELASAIVVADIFLISLNAKRDDTSHKGPYPKLYAVECFAAAVYGVEVRIVVLFLNCSTIERDTTRQGLRRAQ